MLGFVVFALNIDWIGYYQNVERSRKVTFFMLLRGVTLMGLFFVTLAPLLGEKGPWLAIPCSEVVVFLLLVSDHFLLRRRMASSRG